MRRSLASILVAALALAACASAPTPAEKHQVRPTVVPAGMQTCDDGGSGGVVIDGVCL
ncbi:MAG: hypothetical protein U1E34_03040 [Amaricoccus sp.]